MIFSLTDELFFFQKNCANCYTGIQIRTSFCLKRAVQSFLQELFPPSIFPHGKFTEPSRGIIFQKIRFCLQRRVHNCLDMLKKCYTVALVLPTENFTKPFRGMLLRRLVLYQDNIIEPCRGMLLRRIVCTKPSREKLPRRLAQSQENFKSRPENCYSVLQLLSFRKTERRVLFCV